MPTALLIAAAFVVCLVLPGSASAKQPRSASVKGTFQLTHPSVRRQGAQAARAPVTSRTTSCRLPVAVLMLSLTYSGKRSAMRRQRINGRQRAAVGRREAAISRQARRVLSYAAGTLTSFSSAAAADNIQAPVDRPALPASGSAPAGSIVWRCCRPTGPPEAYNSVEVYSWGLVSTLAPVADNTDSRAADRGNTGMGI
jgi:hypothetical protein